MYGACTYVPVLLLFANRSAKQTGVRGRRKAQNFDVTRTALLHSSLESHPRIDKTCVLSKPVRVGEKSRGMWRWHTCANQVTQSGHMMDPALRLADLRGKVGGPRWHGKASRRFRGGYVFPG